MELTDEQWDLIKGILPSPPQREDGKGRPRREARSVLEGILWVLRKGAPWKDLPGRFPPYQTCHRRFQEWVEAIFDSRSVSIVAPSRNKSCEIGNFHWTLR